MMVLADICSVLSVALFYLELSLAGNCSRSCCQRWAFEDIFWVAMTSAGAQPSFIFVDNCPATPLLFPITRL